MMVSSSLTATLLAIFAPACVYARDPLQNAISVNLAPPPGFSETLSIYGEPEPKVPPPKALATTFSIYLQLSSTDEWEVFNVSAIDYTTCHTLDPALRARKSHIRAALSSTGSRDAQPGIKNMMFSFPENTIAPDIRIMVFRTAPPPVKNGRVASASANPSGACYNAKGSRDPRIVNLREWADKNEDDRLDWLKPRWWAPFYYRLRGTDSFLVLPPPVIGRVTVGPLRAPPAGASKALQTQKDREKFQQRQKSYAVLRELGVDFA